MKNSVLIISLLTVMVTVASGAVCDVILDTSSGSATYLYNRGAAITIDGFEIRSSFGYLISKPLPYFTMDLLMHGFTVTESSAQAFIATSSSSVTMDTGESLKLGADLLASLNPDATDLYLLVGGQVLSCNLLVAHPEDIPLVLNVSDPSNFLLTNAGSSAIELDSYTISSGTRKLKVQQESALGQGFTVADSSDSSLWEISSGYGVILPGQTINLGDLGTSSNPADYWISGTDEEHHMRLGTAYFNGMVVPEPGSITLLALGAAAMLRRRRVA